MIARAALCGLVAMVSFVVSRPAAAANPSEVRVEATMSLWHASVSGQGVVDSTIQPEWWNYVHPDPVALAQEVCATLVPSDAEASDSWFDGTSVKTDPARTNQASSFNLGCIYYSFGGKFKSTKVVGSLRRQWGCPVGYSLVMSDARFDGSDYVPRCEPPTVVPGKDVGKCKECNGTNPVNQANGNKVERETDYVGAGPFPLRLERYYNSQASIEVDFYTPQMPATTGTAPGIADILFRRQPWDIPKLKSGHKWRHSYERAITSARGGEKPTLAWVHRADGKTLAFQKSGPTWVSDPDIELRLEGDFAVDGTALAWRLIDTDDTVEHYDGAGRLTRIVKRGGLSQTLAYDADGYLASVADDFGRTLAFVRDADNALDRVIDPAGRVIDFQYDADGKLVGVTRPDGTAREYKYEHPTWVDALTEIVDETGNWFARFSYATNNSRAILSQHNGGAQAVALAYPSSSVATLTDAHGRTQTYTHTTLHGVRRLTSITGGPCGACGPQAATITYDANGRVATRTDFNGVRTDTVHDARGLETSRTEAANVTALKRTITTTWHPTFRLPALRTEPGRTTAWTYDAAGNRTEETVTDTATGTARTTRWTWSPQGLLLSMDGPREDVDDVTAYRYDAAGNLIEVENALGHVTRITAHDAHGNPLTVIDANDVVTNLVYDERLRLVSRTVAGAETHFDYLPAGLLEKVTSPDGSFIQYHYDAAHRVIAIEDALGNRIDYTLDGFGNRIDEQVKDPAGQLQRRVERTFNTLNQLASLIGAAGTTQYTYDTEGQRLTTTDALSRVTTNAFDALRRLKQTTDPALGVTAYSYDARDNLTKVVDPRGITTNYVYDGFDLATRVESPDAGTTTYQYDLAGNRVSQTDARGVATSYAYDALNRLTAVRYADSDFDVEYTWDEGDHGIGRLSETTDRHGRTAYTYDAHGNVIEVERTTDGVTLTVGYAYDAADRLIELRYPSGARVTLARDAAGRVSAATLVRADGSQQSLATDIVYQAFGGLAALQFGNGQLHQRSYDLDGRVTAIQTASVQALAYGYDAAGNLTALEDLANTAKSQSFGYDALDRLTAATGAYGSQGFQYDAVGNRLSLTTAEGSEAYGYDAVSNRLLTVGTRAYAYDEVGNTLADGRFSYVYDPRNRLAEVYTGADLLARYGYDAQGQRVVKVAGAPDTTDYAALAAEAQAQADAARAEAERLTEEAEAKSTEAEAKETEASEARAEQDAALESAAEHSANAGEIRADAEAVLAAATAEADAAQAAGQTADAQAAIADAASQAATQQAIALREQSATAAAEAAAAEAQAETLSAQAAQATADAAAQEAYALDQREVQVAFLAEAQVQAALEQQLRAEAAALLAEAEPELAKARAFRAKIVTPPKNFGQRIKNAIFEGLAQFFEWRVRDLTEAAAEKLAQAEAAHAAMLTAQVNAAQADANAIQATQNAIALRAQAEAAGAQATALAAAAEALNAEAAQLSAQAGIQEAVALQQSQVRDAALAEAASHYAAEAAIRAEAAAAYAASIAEADAEQALADAATATAAEAEQRSIAATDAAIALRDEAEALTAQADEQTLLADASQAEADHFAELANNPPINQQTTLFAYDQQGHLIGEYDGTGTVRREYVWLRDLPLAVVTPGTVNYIQADHLNTPVSMTDGTLATTWTATREPFGETTVEGTAELPLRFPGQYEDMETGLHYNYFRDYDPEAGRYVESDPIGLGGGLNVFAYANGSPLVGADPTGEATEAALGFCVAGGPLNPVCDVAIAVNACKWAGIAVAAGIAISTSMSCDDEKKCGRDDDDSDCKSAIAEARRIYGELTGRAIPQYMYGSRHGQGNVGHHDAITQGQRSLQRAINRVKKNCKTPPAELAKWETLANQSFPMRH